MILKALCDYYDICSDLPRKGMELKEIGYAIVINQEGHFKRIESLMIDKKRANLFLVAQTIKRSGTKYIANFLWDNCEYVLGFSEAKPEKAILCRQKFMERVQELKSRIPDNTYLTAISLFYDEIDMNLEHLKSDELWENLVKSNKNISFLIEGVTHIAAVDKEILSHILNKEEIDGENICMVTGKKGMIARLHANIPLKGNAFTSLVSFQKKQGYDSYGKEQAFNAPISEEAAFKYTTALNKLLEFDSHHQFSISSRIFVFWASSNNDVSNEAEENFYAMCSSPSNDDPNRGIAYVRKVFNDIYSGIKPTSDNDRFYILGLAPNSARIAVVYWNECSLKEFAGLILRHFDDMEIVDARAEGKKKPYQGLHQMMGAVTLGGKSGDVQSNLPEATIKSIMQGIPYPATLYQACIRRIRAEQEVSPYMNPCRMAIIKAYLNRLKNNEKKIKSMTLDKQNNNAGYLCGRLFATLEKIQEDAYHIHSIRERYMNAASSTPSAVFATLLNLSVHHIEKLSKGSQIFYEKLKQDIVSELPGNDFPAHLDLQDQGRFFIGYYQQRQEFFTSKEAKKAEVNIEEDNYE